MKKLFIILPLLISLNSNTASAVITTATPTTTKKSAYVKPALKIAAAIAISAIAGKLLYDRSSLSSETQSGFLFFKGQTHLHTAAVSALTGILSAISFKSALDDLGYTPAIKEFAKDCIDQI